MSRDEFKSWFIRFQAKNMRHNGKTPIDEVAEEFCQIMENSGESDWELVAQSLVLVAVSEGFANW